MPSRGDRAPAVGLPRAHAGPEAGHAASATSWSSRTTATPPARRSSTRTRSSSPCRSCRARARGGDGARQHYLHKERCIYCDIIQQEQADRVRVIAENADFIALAPYAPRFPFETWLLPKRHDLGLRGRRASRAREPRAHAQGDAAADEPDAAVAALQLDHPHRAVRTGRLGPSTTGTWRSCPS